MTVENGSNQQAPRLECPVSVVCPICRGTLIPTGGSIECTSCKKCFDFRDGFPDLIVGGRFDDAADEARTCYEEAMNGDVTRNYWLPLFHTLWAPRELPRRILSVGCGTGVDIDLLCAAGFDAIGIDCGNRSTVWPRRRNRDRLLLANGKHLPFEDQTFDGAFCGCVFPHVGVVGDSFQVTPQYDEDRLRLASEMTRVLKPHGKILVSSPNRLFPCDIFHGREADSYKPRPYWPGDPFLLSVADYRRLFQQAGCTTVEAQPVQGYWGFIRSKRSLKGFLLGLPVRFLFWLVSLKGARGLQGSPLTPWIVVLAEKGKHI
jgi:SAM-dependent methyltransferase